MSAIEDIAQGFAAMMRAGQFEAAGNLYWAPDVASIEPEGPAGGARATVTGIEAARRKCHARFYGARLDEIGIDGPFVTGNQFALFVDMVAVDPATGARRPFTEIALYTVRGGRISEERYFYD